MVLVLSLDILGTDFGPFWNLCWLKVGSCFERGSVHPRTPSEARKGWKCHAQADAGNDIQSSVGTETQEQIQAHKSWIGCFAYDAIAIFLQFLSFNALPVHMSDQVVLKVSV